MAWLQQLLEAIEQIECLTRAQLVGFDPGQLFHHGVGQGGWDVAPYSPAQGTVSLTLRSGEACPCTPLGITGNPSAASAPVGAPVSFSVAVSGSNPEFQWQKDEVDLPGATGATLLIPAVRATDAGRYRVVATNCCSRVVSAPADLTVNCPADFNGDGFVDFFDYDDYVNCFEAGACPPGKTADVNGDNFVDFFDYDDFVNAFQTGC